MANKQITIQHDLCSNVQASMQLQKANNHSMLGVNHSGVVHPPVLKLVAYNRKTFLNMIKSGAYHKSMSYRCLNDTHDAADTIIEVKFARTHL